MNKKLFLFIAVLLMGGLAFSGLAFAGSTEIFGQGGYPSEPHKIYRLVHNPNATAISAESIVIWDLTADNGVSVTTATVSGDSAVAGILAETLPAQATAANTAAQDIGKANWALMQTYGLAQVYVDIAVGLEGSAMGASAPTGGRVGEASPYAEMYNPHPRYSGMAGFFYDTADAGDDDVECFLTLD